MKTIRHGLLLAGLLSAIFTLGAAGAKAQLFGSEHFAGTFTLPFQVQWGAMTLPAGKYTLKYGCLPGSNCLVEVAGKAKGIPRSVVLALPPEQNSPKKNALICSRNGGTGIVLALEMSEIGESVSFPIPRGAKLLAHQQRHGKYTLAEAPMLIQRIPVTFGSK